MALINFGNFNNVMQKVILPAVQQQLYEKAPLWQIFRGWSAETNIPSKVNIGGISFMNNQIFVPLKTSRSNGVVAVNTGNNLINGLPQTDQGSISIVTETGSFLIPKQLLNVNQPAGAIVNSLQFYTEDLANSMAMDLNRQGYGDGTGTIGTVVGAVSAVSSGTSVFTASLNGDVTFERYVPIGTQLTINSAALAAGVTATQIITVTNITGPNTFTWTSTTAVTFSAGAVVQKIDGSNAVVTELAGLNAIISSTSTYMNISPSTDYTWKAGYFDNNGGTTKPFSMVDLDTAFLKANATGNVKLLIANMTEFRKYAESLVSQLRFQKKEVLTGGWMGIDYMGGNATVLLDYDCPDDRWYLLSPDFLFQAEFQKMEFEKGTDGNLLRVAGTLNFEVASSWMGNILTNKRSAHAALANRS